MCMKKYILLLSILPIFSFAQQCDTIYPVQYADTIIYCITNASCHDTCDGRIAIEVIGNNQPYSFEWNNSNISTAGDNSRDSLCASSHLVTITDVNGNLVDNSQISTVEDPPNFSVFEILTNPTCFNYADGSIALNIGGATPPYTYLWNNGISSLNRDSLDSGVYMLTTMDANNCIRIDTFSLSNPNEVNSTTISDTLSCIGLCDGTGIVIPSNGVAPYTYFWDDGQANDTATNLCYGINTVFITDANGCLDTNEVDIANPDTLQLSNINIDSACYQICDGQLSVTIEGGQSPYSTSWNFNGTEFNNTDTITDNDLCPGNYQLIYTDANNCSDTALIPLIERDSFIVEGWVIDDSCYNSCTGQITVQLLNQENPPFIYSWNNGGNDTVISNLCSDTFELVIIDDRLCRDTLSFYVEPGDSMYFEDVEVTHNSCYGDTVGAISLINFNGGVLPLEYLWSNSEITSGINSLSAALFNVTVTDANGCSLDSSNIEVSQPDSLFITPSSEDVLCSGGQDGLIDLDIFGGIEPYFISWNNQIPDSTLIDTVSAGEYVYTLLDSNACVVSDTILINEPDELIITDSLINILCHGENTGEIHLAITGGTSPYLYSIDGGVTFQSQNYFDNLIVGSYSIVIKDANDCILSSPLYNIVEPLTSLTASLTSPNLLCFSDTGTILLTVNGGIPNYSILWDNGTITQNLYGVGAGNYSVTILDENDCEVIDSINVSEPNEINVNAVITDLLCFEDGGGAINVTTSGGVLSYDYSWDNGDTIPDLANLLAGTYELTITDGNNCNHIESFTVVEPNPLGVSSNLTHVDCFGNSTGEVDITVSGGTQNYSFDWSNLSSNEDLSNIPAGNYAVIITDINNCTISASVNINEPTEITYAVSTIDLVCNNIFEGEINIITSGGTPGYSYSIDGGVSYQNSNVFTNLQAGNYSVWIKDANNCEKSQSYSITQPNGYSTDVIIQNIESCNGDATGSINFTISGNTPPYSYSWSNNESTSSISGIIVGNYEVTVSDANNCEMTYSYFVSEPEAIFLDYDIQLASCEEKNDGAITTMVIGGTAPYYYQWGTGETTSDLFYLSKGQYSLSISDSKGCTLPIKYFDVSFDGLNGCVEIPSGFTPNNDNIHDEWVIYGLSDFPDVVVKIYNRWGQEIYSSKGYNKPWDGKFKGVDLPTAAYYYVIELNESDKVFNGTVTIKR
jgi:gliding motility-associated-like protein